MVYQIGPGDTAQWDDWPHTLREFWSRAHKGIYIPDFEAGFALGQSDITNDTTTGFDSLDTVESHLRDEAWHARLDGYKQATRKARGITKYG